MLNSASTQHLHYVTLFNGCRMAFTDEGESGETLLFIHGLGTNCRTWQKNIPVLSKQFRCIAIDLPGSGHSSTGEYSYTMDFFAHCIIDFIGRMNLEKVTLVGHSMGGQIALTVSLVMPECCEMIILFSPSGFEQFSYHERMFYEASLRYMSMLSTNEQFIQHLVHTGFHRFPKDAQPLESGLVKLMRMQPPGHYKTMTERCVAGMFAAPVFSQLKDVTQDVLVFFGEDDALIPNTMIHPGTTRKIAEAGARQLRHAGLKMIPNCGHFVQWEQAAEVNKQMQLWLRKSVKDLSVP